MWPFTPRVAITPRHHHCFFPKGAWEPPTKSGGYTQVVVLLCECGAVDLFPSVNLALVADDVVAEFDTELRTRGQFLIPPHLTG